MNTYDGHTPGPWFVNRAHGGYPTIFAGAALIAAVRGAPGVADSVIAANARLIAAAPDMLRQRDALARGLLDAVASLERMREEPNSEWAQEESKRVLIRARAALSLVERGAGE